MGACLSCLGLSSQKSSEPEHSHLLYSDDPYNQSGNSYGTWGGQAPQGLAPQHTMSPEEMKRERDALENITRWTGDHIVDIFSHQNRKPAEAAVNGEASAANGSLAYDAIVAQIPGDKSTKSLRIYPISRPGSQASAGSGRSRMSSSKLHGSVRRHASRVFVKLDLDNP